MNRVIHQLYIGCADDFNSPDKMRVEEISDVVKLYESRAEYPAISPDFTVWERPVVDGEGWTDSWLHDVIDLIDLNLRSGKSTIVCCAAGKSRSAVVILAYLCVHQNLKLWQAWFVLYRARPSVDPSIDLLAFLMKFLGVHPYLSTLIGTS